MKNFAQSLLSLWKEFGINQRVSLVITALAVVGGLVAVMFWAQRPDYQLLYTRLGDKDAVAIIGFWRPRISRTR
jgi:flagellar M-ring protein FliF